ncbi:MAG: YbaY family lipoprotein [Chloroflexi bacterium]|nr:YbaY family lipoprotein [Chloroflexota bacterium]MCY3587671.1 YbaY family lipoprotein [Chloroflexota bacterium]MCY3686288.1 YbaY family lipoprotein [Chloroflexota bacterium]MDE2708909.1 YbaY family lipoprotein [Chloroflexota bacterium]
MPPLFVPFIWLAAVLLLACAATACGSVNTVSGEVQFHRDVDLPDGATVTVWLLDTSYADADAIELGRDVIANAEQLPIRFSIEYNPNDVDDRAEITLSAQVDLGNELLYINDTVHPVLTRGAPRNSDVRVISISEFDQCVEPLRGQIHTGFWDGDLPDDAVLEIRLWDVSEPEERFVVVQASFDDLGSFPIQFELPYEGVQISRHHRYELEANISFDGELQFHIPNPEWRRTILPYCPDGDDLSIVNDVFPVSEFPAE